jgi:dsRNA-specific ribonuclease
VVLRHWSSVIDERAVSPGERDYKTRLQEVLAQSGTVPEYAIVASGPDHERSLCATVVITAGCRHRGNREKGAPNRRRHGGRSGVREGA